MCKSGSKAKSQKKSETGYQKLRATQLSVDSSRKDEFLSCCYGSAVMIRLQWRHFGNLACIDLRHQSSMRNREPA